MSVLAHIARRLRRHGVPLLSVLMGIIFVTTKMYNHSIVGPVMKGNYVGFVGMLFIVFGFVGFLAQLLEDTRT